ncbi:SH22A protein, partial [Penelope pileata]|nr:SH22A protein [Penelope pileata]
GGSMDDTHPLFITFKPVAEGTSTQPGHGTTLLHPQRAEQPPGQHHAQGGGSQLLPTAPQVPRGALATLRARTQLWFEQTQAPRLRAEGELPAWFHGFISRRETEQLLQDEPPGCFLVRFSESTVGFVLSYRGRDRCRHFVLDQLPDGRYVILGEHSAHPELPQLLQHYSHAPIPPYNELLTVPYRQPPGRGSPSCRVPGNPAAYSTVAKRGPGARQGAKSCPQGGSGEVKEELGAWRCFQGRAQPEAAPTEPPDAKYQQLLRFHTYADPQEGTARREEPIPFYAMGRGSSPSPEENVYAEV